MGRLVGQDGVARILGQQSGGVRGVDHVCAVVAEEDVVGYDVRSDLQVGRCSGIAAGGQRGAVAAKIDRAFDHGGALRVVGVEAYGHLLGVGAHLVQGLGREQLVGFGGCSTAFGESPRCGLCAHQLLHVVVEVAPDEVALHGGVVGIGVGAVAAAVDIAADAGIDTHGVATAYVAGDVVATIYIGDVAAAHEHTGGVAGGELIALVAELDVGVGHLHTVYHGVDIGPAAAAEDVLGLEQRRLGNLEQDALVVGHAPFVAAAVEVDDAAPGEVPLRADGHVGLVVAAEDAQELVLAGFKRREVQAHRQ